MNTTTITLGGKEIELRASNWASQLYATEFSGQDRGNYGTNLALDTLQLMSDCIGEFNEDGTITVKFVIMELWGIVWALAAAAGSVKVSYSKWMESARDEIWTVDEQAQACVDVIDLVTESFFR